MLIGKQATTLDRQRRMHMQQHQKVQQEQQRRHSSPVLSDRQHRQPLQCQRRQYYCRRYGDHLDSNYDDEGADEFEDEANDGERDNEDSPESYSASPMAELRRRRRRQMAATRCGRDKRKAARQASLSPAPMRCSGGRCERQPPQPLPQQSPSQVKTMTSQQPHQHLCRHDRDDCSGRSGCAYGQRLRALSLDAESAPDQRHQGQRRMAQSHLLPLGGRLAGDRRPPRQLRSRQDLSPPASSCGGARSPDASSYGSINNSGWCEDATYECRSRLRGRPLQQPQPQQHQQQQQRQQQQFQPQTGNSHRSSKRHQYQQQQQPAQHHYERQSCAPPLRRHTGRRYPDPEQSRIYGSGTVCEARGGYGSCSGANANDSSSGNEQCCRHQVQLVIQVMEYGCNSAVAAAGYGGGGSWAEDDQAYEQPEQPPLPPPTQRQRQTKCRPIWGSDGHHQDDERASAGASTAAQVHRVTLPCCCRLKPPR